jgi:hypothetical protein
MLPLPPAPASVAPGRGPPAAAAVAACAPSEDDLEVGGATCGAEACWIPWRITCAQAAAEYTSTSEQQKCRQAGKREPRCRSARSRAQLSAQPTPVIKARPGFRQRVRFSWRFRRCRTPECRAPSTPLLAPVHLRPFHQLLQTQHRPGNGKQPALEASTHYPPKRRRAHRQEGEADAADGRGPARAFAGTDLFRVDVESEYLDEKGNHTLPAQPPFLRKHM